MNIYICVGSSCHLKGSYNIIALMKESLAKYQLTDKVNVSAAFCLGRCTDGVTIKVDERLSPVYPPKISIRSLHSMF